MTKELDLLSQITAAAKVLDEKSDAVVNGLIEWFEAALRKMYAGRRIGDIWPPDARFCSEKWERQDGKSGRTLTQLGFDICPKWRVPGRATNDWMLVVGKFELESSVEAGDPDPDDPNLDLYSLRPSATMPLLETDRTHRIEAIKLLPVILKTFETIVAEVGEEDLK